MAEMNAQQIYDNFHQGVGGDGLASGAALVRKVAARYGERVAMIRQLEAEMDAAWQGEAAGAARRGAGPLLMEHDLAGHHLVTAEDLTDRQSASFSRAKNSVMPVPPMPTEVQPFGQLAADWVPFKQQLTEHYQAAQHNVDVMNVYSGASSYNTEHLPTAYGALADDQAGIAIGGADTIDVDDSADSADSGAPADGDFAGPREVAPGPYPASDGPDPTNRPGPAGLPPGPSTPPSDSSLGPGGGTTSPGGYLPVAGGSLGTPGIDLGQPRSGANSGGLVPGAGIGFPGDNSTDGIRGGPGGGPRGAVAGGAPRGGVGGPGRGVPAETGGPGVRANGPAGRGGGLGGMPLGGGRGRDDEDRERTVPAYLEGEDPDVLFGCDVLTAPAVIGDEDDD
jgi:hypothetical protein